MTQEDIVKFEEALRAELNKGRGLHATLTAAGMNEAQGQAMLATMGANMAEAAAADLTKAAAAQAKWAPYKPA